MPYVDPERRNEAKRRARQRELIARGPCARCGSNEDLAYVAVWRKPSIVVCGVCRAIESPRPGFRRCRACGEEKPTSDFHRQARAKDGLRTQCKKCDLDYLAEWRERNGEAYREYHRDWNRRNSDQEKCRKYGLSSDQLASLRLAADGRCTLCGDATKRLVIDHDHETGRVRGLLCSPCNTALGRLGDNVVGLERAIAYLKQAGCTDRLSEPVL